MTISDEDLRRALEERIQAAAAPAAASLSARARTVALDTPRPASFQRRFGLHWVAIAATAALLVAVAVAVAPGTRPAPSVSESRDASAMPATAVPPNQSSVPSGAPTPLPSPASMVIDGCSDLGFDARRCSAVVAKAAESLDPAVSLEDVIRAVVSRPAPSETLGSSPIAGVLLSLRGGSDKSVDVWCASIPSPWDRVCNPDARVTVTGGIDHDVPCTGPGGDPGTSCATPVPTPRPASVDSARPLRLAKHTVLFDHLGHYEIHIGDAGLPDGALREMSFDVADHQPATYWIDGGVRLEVRPDDPARPPVGSVFRTPFKGVELVHVYLVFDVSEVNADSTLEAIDIVVR
jgi:hypothetical protein